MTTASCGGEEGWSQTFSNNLEFASWALNKVRVPTKFATYVHGKDVAKEIKEKPAQPSDERSIRLRRVLNDLIGTFLIDTYVYLFLV